MTSPTMPRPRRRPFGWIVWGKMGRVCHANANAFDKGYDAYWDGVDASENPHEENPDVLAQEIVDDMQTALDQFSAVVEGLREDA